MILSNAKLSTNSIICKEESEYGDEEEPIPMEIKIVFPILTILLFLIVIYQYFLYLESKKKIFRMINHFRQGQEPIYELLKLYRYILDFFVLETRSKKGALLLYSRQESQFHGFILQDAALAEKFFPLPPNNNPSAYFPDSVPQLLPLSNLTSPPASEIFLEVANALQKEGLTHFFLLLKRNLLLGMIVLGYPTRKIPKEVLGALLETVGHSLENLYLYESAITDEITGLFNKRFFQRSLEAEIQRSRRYQQSCTLVAFDIDDFKKVNDRYGHLQGDRLLKELAELLQECLRKGVDISARTGGEEFHVILPETDSEGGGKTAERIRETVRNHSFSGIPHGERITLSLGIATYPAEANEDITLLALADKALYQAKTGGKDRICTAGKLPVETN